MKDDTIVSVGRIRLKGLALLALAFVAGGMAGAAVEHLRTSEPETFGPITRPGGPTPPMQRGPGSIVPPVFDRLDLTERQRGEIRRILEESRPTTDSLLAEVMPRLRSITDSVRREIRAVLTEEQRERLESEFPAFRGPGPPILRGETGRGSKFP